MNRPIVPESGAEDWETRREAATLANTRPVPRGPGAVARTCAVPGCTECMSEGGTLYCATHSRRRGYDTRRTCNTFLFKCASCPFEAHISNRKRNKVYCDDCASQKRREQCVRYRANTGAPGQGQANVTEACPPTQRSEQR